MRNHGLAGIDGFSAGIWTRKLLCKSLLPRLEASDVRGKEMSEFEMQSTSNLQHIFRDLDAFIHYSPLAILENEERPQPPILFPLSPKLHERT